MRRHAGCDTGSGVSRDIMMTSCAKRDMIHERGRTTWENMGGMTTEEGEGQEGKEEERRQSDADLSTKSTSHNSW